MNQLARRSCHGSRVLVDHGIDVPALLKWGKSKRIKADDLQVVILRHRFERSRGSIDGGPHQGYNHIETGIRPQCILGFLLLVRDVKCPHSLLYNANAGIILGEKLFKSARANHDPGNVRIYTQEGDGSIDRKSTRLNSSHLGISYAVFCLKKK